MAINNSDISRYMTSKWGGTLKTYSHSSEQIYSNPTNPLSTKVWGYVAYAPDKEMLDNEYFVNVPEFGNSIIRAKVIRPVTDGGGGNGTFPKGITLETGCLVVLETIGGMNNYFITGVIPMSGESVQYMIDNDVTLKPFAPPPDGTNYYQRFDPNLLSMGVDSEISLTPLDIITKNPFGVQTVPPPRLPGSYEVKSTIGDRFRRTLGSDMEISPDRVFVADGISGSASEKASARIVRNYQRKKLRIQRSLPRRYVFRNGQIIPGAILVNQATSLAQSAGLNNIGLSSFLAEFNEIVGYVNKVMGVVETMNKVVDWFSKSYIDQLKDIIDLAGISQIDIGGVVQISTSFNVDSPIGLSADFNTGIPLMDSFLEGFSNSLLRDFIGDTSIGGILGLGLGLLGGGGGIDDPDETYAVNLYNKPIVTTGELGNTDSLKSIISELGSYVSGDINQFMNQLTSSNKTIRIGGEGAQFFEDTHAQTIRAINLNDINVQVGSKEAQLAIFITKYGVEYGGMVTQAIRDLYYSSSLLHFMMALLPLLETPEKIQVLAGIGYITGQASVIEPVALEVFNQGGGGSCNAQVTTLATADYTNKDVVNKMLDEEFGIDTPPDFDAWTQGIDNVLDFFSNTNLSVAAVHLADGKLSSFFREIIKLQSGIDVATLPRAYVTFNELINAVFPAESIGYE